VARFAPNVQVIDTATNQPAGLSQRAGPSQPGGPPARRIGWRQILWVCGTALAVFFMYFGGSHLGPAIRAAHGQGIRGTWVAQQCGSGNGHCTWYGKFVLPDGTVALPSVSYGGHLTAVHAGLAVPALDSGAGNEVYPPSGSTQWVHDVIGLAGGAVVFVLMVGWWVIAWRRHHRTSGP
jgi:hypothetical protein